jgi:hypothetical protein
MTSTNYLTYKNGSVQIHGFEDLYGEFVHLRALAQGVMFKKRTQEDLSSCIKFESEILNKAATIEFFKEHNVFCTGYTNLNGVYYPAEDNSKFDETRACTVIPINDLL